MANIINIAALAANLSVTGASANVALPSKGAYVVITNYGTGPAFVNVGDSTVTASATANICVPAGAQCSFVLSGNPSHLAAISTSTTSLNILKNIDVCTSARKTNNMWITVGRHSVRGNRCRSISMENL